MGAEEPESPRHDGRPPVGADDEARRDPPGGRAVPGPHRLHPDHAAARGQEVGHAHAFSHGHAQVARPLDEDRVEVPPRRGERVVPVAPPGPVARVVADDLGAVGSGDAHAPERPRPRLDGLEHPQAIEDPADLGGEVLPADLVPGESGPVEERDGVADTGEEDRRRGAGGAGAHHDDVSARPGPGHTPRSPGRRWRGARRPPARPRPRRGGGARLACTPAGRRAARRGG